TKPRSSRSTHFPYTTLFRSRDTYVEYDPDHADDYNANTEAYLAELKELHAYVLEQAERVPDEQRVLITAHDAFHYFGRAYGFEVDRKSTRLNSSHVKISYAV